MNYNKLEIRRREKKITQGELTEKAGLTISGYSKIIKNGNPEIKTLERISEVLEVNMSYWWEEEEVLTVQEPKVDLIKLLTKENRKLKEQAERDKRTIDRLHDQIDNLEGKVKRKATG
jgi:transcriptional regulator with XRE-family HTH domain